MPESNINVFINSGNQEPPYRTIQRSPFPLIPLLEPLHSPIPEERKAGAAKLQQAQGVVPDNNVSHSAYLVFMSADACLVECSFSLCARF